MISALAFSDCGNYIISGDTMGNIQMQNVHTFQTISYQNVRNAITYITFRENIFIVGTIKGTIFLYQTNSTKFLRSFSFHKNSITFIEIHPNLEYFASASMDGYIRVYSITLCACVRIWKSSGKIPLSCRFSHNGKWIIVTCDDGLMDIIDVGDAKVIRSLIIDAYTIDACFSPNDRRFAVVDRTGGFSLWDVDDLGKESLTVLRIDNIEPFTVQYLENDEIRVVGKYSDKNYGNENY